MPTQGNAFAESSRYLYTSESVTEGHPDKVCDQVSDSILDAIYAQDPQARVACETATGTNFIAVIGEITTTATVDYEQVVRDTLKRIGYDSAETGIDYNSCEVLVRLHEQSPDISNGVTTALEPRNNELGRHPVVLVKTHRQQSTLLRSETRDFALCFACPTGFEPPVNDRGQVILGADQARCRTTTGCHHSLEVTHLIRKQFNLGLRKSTCITQVLLMLNRSKVFQSFDRSIRIFATEALFLQTLTLSV